MGVSCLIELGVNLSRPFCEMVPGCNRGDLFFHHHHPVFWVGPASDFRGRVWRMVLWLGALGFQAKVWHKAPAPPKLAFTCRRQVNMCRARNDFRYSRN